MAINLTEGQESVEGGPDLLSEDEPRENHNEPIDFGGLDLEDSDDLALAYEHSLRNFEEGEVVRGAVVAIEGDKVLVDINYKSEGTIPISEFPSVAEVTPGDEFDVYIEEPEGEDGMPILSKVKADRIKNWTEIQRKYENGEDIPGKVIRRVKGGLKVDIGMDAFLPASQVAWRPSGDLDQYIGQTYEFRIIKLTKKRRNVVVSRRALLEEERNAQKETLLKTLEESQVVEGIVRNITDFGAFVDVGGIDGLLHVTDMSWGRVRHPSEIVSVGDKIGVVVLNFDRQNEKISLGLKQKTPNPWNTVAERYEESSIYHGRVVSMTDYGAFVELEKGVEGMVHVSEMSWTKRVKHPSEIVDLADEIDVMILNIDAENQKISLGIKETLPNPWLALEEKYPPNSEVEGEVRNLTDYGAFIQIEEGIDGLLHISDMSWTQKVNHPSEILKKGQIVHTQVLSIDPQKEKISLGLKQLERDPWLDVENEYPIDSLVDVQVSKLVSFGAFARLPNGIEGLIHLSELSDDRSQRPEQIVKIGDDLKVKIIRVDPDERKIGLSLKQTDENYEGPPDSEEGAASEPAPVSADPEGGVSEEEDSPEAHASAEAQESDNSETPEVAQESDEAESPEVEIHAEEKAE